MSNRAEVEEFVKDVLNGEVPYRTPMWLLELAENMVNAGWTKLK